MGRNQMVDEEELYLGSVTFSEGGYESNNDNYLKDEEDLKLSRAAEMSEEDETINFKEGNEEEQEKDEKEREEGETEDLESPVVFEGLEDSQSTTGQDKGKSNTIIYDFYCVYVLQSISHPTKFYIGSTPNPSRRLAQHNGHQKQGAYKTSSESFRPWQMACIVHGFSNRISALQFENAVQKPDLTKHISEEMKIVLFGELKERKSVSNGSSQKSKTKGKGKRTRRAKPVRRGLKKGMEQYLGVIRALLNDVYFLRMRLCVELFSKEANQVWCDNKYSIIFNLDRHIVSSCKYFDAGECYLKMTQIIQFYRESISKKRQEKRKCRICKKSEKNKEGTDEFNSLLTCYHDGCDYEAHLKCMSVRFLKHENSSSSSNSGSRRNSAPSSQRDSQLNLFATIPQKHILPVKGKCPGCKTMTYWNALVKYNNNSSADCR